MLGGALCNDYTINWYEGNVTGEDTTFDNYTIEVKGEVEEYRNIYVKKKLEIRGNFGLHSKMTLLEGAQLIVITDGATKGFKIYSQNGILDLSAITDVSNFIFGEEYVECYGTIILPTKITNGTVIMPLDFYSITNITPYLKYYIEPEISVKDGFIQIGSSNSEYDFSGFNYESGTNTQPTISAITRKVFYKDLTNSPVANKSENTLDLINLSDVDFDDVIREDSGDINFTLLTTPSKGITIADGVSVTGPINIRLKLCGE